MILEKPGSSLWLFCGLAMASPAEWATGEGAPRGRVLGCLSGHCPHVCVCARAHVCAFLSLAVCTCASASPALCGRPVPVVLWSPRRSLRRFPGPGAQAPAGPRLAEPSVVGALLRAARRGHHRPGGQAALPLSVGLDRQHSMWPSARWAWGCRLIICVTLTPSGRSLYFPVSALFWISSPFLSRSI